MANIREGKQVSSSDDDMEPKNMNMFYAFQSKHDQEWYPHVNIQYVLLLWF